MSDIHRDSPVHSADEIRVVGMNTDKTRLIAGSETEYHVYFILSEAPAQVWRIIFLDQWRSVPTAPPAVWAQAFIDGAFLRIDCPLKDVVPTYYPALKKVVAETNKAYKQRVQDDASAEKTREDVWTKERKAVEEVAALLHFE